MNFRSKGGALLIEMPGGRSIEPNADTLFVSVGEVKPSYRMSRGSFKIRQKKLSETRLFLSHVKDGDGGAELELSSKNGGAVLAVSLTEDNGILKFAFSTAAITTALLSGFPRLLTSPSTAAERPSPNLTCAASGRGCGSPST